LEIDPRFHFITYPVCPWPDLSTCLLLSVEGEPLTQADLGRPLLLIDGTWRLAKTMEQQLPFSLPRRRLPSWIRTAYPRRQTECPNPETGLASVEAIYAAFATLGLPTEGLLDHYYWKDEFLRLNHKFRDSDHS
jgi:pre-rRNA-processing protein TSR3